MLAINGNANARVFEISSGQTVTISDLTITNGSADIGGGIRNTFPATLTVTNCTVSGNSASGSGGGIFNGGATLTINNTTLSGNSANTGGGIENLANLTVSNSTISGNSATSLGGGIRNNGFDSFPILTVSNSTLSGNSASAGGGIEGDFISGFVTLIIGDTILNANTPQNIANNGGTVTSHGYNLSSDDGGGFLTGTGDQINTNPQIGPLQDNGGPTFTHELLSGSPAIDAGDPNFTPPPFFDQRGPGFPRVVNNRIDIGSFEVQGPAVCVQGQGFWKNHPDQWPVVQLQLGNELYTEQQLLSILHQPVRSKRISFAGASVNCRKAEHRQRR